MNKIKLTSLCHELSEETGLSFNSLLTHYFLETVLKRLSESKYRENFIYKGGFLLSNIIGIRSRSTVDIDFLFKNIELSENSVIKILSDVLKDREDENIIYEIKKITPIKENDGYGGFRASILCNLENIKQVLTLDIAAGDVVTPNPIDYLYKRLFKDENINVWAYNIETMIAEKIQTIYSRGVFNSRSKDFYDLYIIYKLKINEIDNYNLKTACERTFEYRNTEFDKIKILELFKLISADKDFVERWARYTNKNSYAKGINFFEVIDSAVKMIDFI